MRITLDADDVILDAAAQKLFWLQEQVKNGKLEERLVAGIQLEECNRTHLAARIGNEKYDEMIEVAYGKEWTRQTRPVDGAVEGIRLLAEEWEIFVLTARKPTHALNVAQWLKQYGLERKVGRVISVQDPSHNRIAPLADSKKAGIAYACGARVHVDDDPRHMPHAPVQNFEGILFGKNPEREAYRPCVQNWPALVTYLRGIRA